jgi:hypothetical protein
MPAGCVNAARLESTSELDESSDGETAFTVAAGLTEAADEPRGNGGSP